MKRTIFFLIAFIFLCPFNCFAQKKAGSIENQIQQIARKFDCQVGVAAIHIESGKKLSYNGNLPFFMASTVKIPIAITLLHRVDTHQDHLDRVITFTQRDSVPGSGCLFDELSRHPSCHSMSLLHLLRLMLVISDNTASDIILNEVKGPKAVSHRLQALGFQHILVDRSIYNLYMSSSGVSHSSLDLHKLEQLNKFIGNINPEKKVRAWKLFEKDIRDTTSPNEMALLLAHLYQGKILSPKSTSLLLKTMTHCQTGRNRIKGLLPACAEVAHKTGTWTIYQDNFIKYPGSKQLYRFANDIGIITLPSHKGHIAIAIYVKSKAVGNGGRERVIAKISKEIYDYFLKQ